MTRRPGTPRLLRSINDQSALELLLERGPLSRTQIGELTGLSKPTASQLVERLEARGLVSVVGYTEGNRGPNAALYSVVPTAAYVAGVDVSNTTTIAAVADLTGAVVGRAQVDTSGSDDAAALVRGAVQQAVESAGISLADVHELVVGTPGLIDPRTGDIGFAWELPTWHEGLREELKRGLGLPVKLENDVNLAALVEQDEGAARGAGDFVLFSIDRGLGMAVVLGGKLHRGSSGGAGEIGYLPVPGAPVSRRVRRRAKGGFGQLAGADTMRKLARDHGFRRGDVAEALAAAVAAGEAGEAYLDEVARRLAVGLTAACVVIDPGLVVVGGSIGRAGGLALASRLQEEVSQISPLRPDVVPSQVDGDVTLRGALTSALRTTRESIFAGTADPESAPEVS